MEFLAGSPAQGCVLIVFTFSPADNTIYGSAAVPPEALGRPYTAKFTSTVPSAGYAIGFAAGGSVSTDATGDSPLSGTVPDNAQTVVTGACGGGLIEVDITIT